MKKIKLYNRDKADLKLEYIKDIGNDISEWRLTVDKEHEYCLKYLRIIGNYPKEIHSIDPSGGPFISVGDVFDNYKIVKICGPTLFWMSEKSNDN